MGTVRQPAKRGVVAWFKRQSHQFKVLATTVGSIGALITGLSIVDSRYANAGDVQQLRSSQERYAVQQEIAILNLRRAYVMDKVYDLSAKEGQMRGRLPPHEKQALERYRQEATDLKRDMDMKQRALDQARIAR
jgi:hypothetical protein